MLNSLDTKKACHRCPPRLFIWSRAKSYFRESEHCESSVVDLLIILVIIFRLRESSRSLALARKVARLVTRCFGTVVSGLSFGRRSDFCVVAETATARIEATSRFMISYTSSHSI